MTTTARPLHEIAREIKADWPVPYFGAAPYLDAMSRLATVSDSFGEDPAREIIVYFLSNAKTWRGDTARRVKAELKGMIK